MLRCSISDNGTEILVFVKPEDSTASSRMHYLHKMPMTNLVNRRSTENMTVPDRDFLRHLGDPRVGGIACFRRPEATTSPTLGAPDGATTMAESIFNQCIQIMCCFEPPTPAIS